MSSRAFKPTRRDLFVAVFSASIALLWSQASHPDHFASVPGRDPWSYADDSDSVQGPPLGFIDYSKSKNQNRPAIPLDLDLSDPEVPVQKYENAQGKSSLKAPEVMPSTTILAHGPGWTLFDNLYMYNGSLLIVSDEDADSFPEPRMMTSTGELNGRWVRS